MRAGRVERLPASTRDRGGDGSQAGQLGALGLHVDKCYSDHLVVAIHDRETIVTLDNAVSCFILLKLTHGVDNKNITVHNTKRTAFHCNRYECTIRS